MVCNTKNLLLGIDIGTQSTRVTLADDKGRIIVTASKANETFYPYPGHAEQTPSEWWNGICTSTKECLEKSGVVSSAIKGISFAATGSTVIMMDKSGKELANAIMWMDNRAVEETVLIKNTRHAILKYTGGQDAVEWMVPKALWLKRNKRKLYERAYMIIEATDWVAYKLTREWVVSQNVATCKWNYVSREGGWNREFFNEIGLEDIFDRWPKKIVPLGRLIGNLTFSASKEMGLIEGIPVVEGGLDAYVGMVGLNALDTKTLGAILGSSNVFTILQEKPVFSESFWGPYPDALLEGMWVIEGGQVSTGSVIQWIVDGVIEAMGCTGSEKEKVIERLDKGVGEVMPGSENLITLDYWQGNRTPRRDPKAKGVFFGLTLGHSIYHLMRSIYEGIAFGTRHIIESLKQNEITIERVVAGGGGTKSSQWMQVLADVCNMHILIPQYANLSVSLGATICAATGVGLYGSIKEAAQTMVTIEKRIVPENDGSVYEASYRNYLRLYEVTKELL